MNVERDYDTLKSCSARIPCEPRSLSRYFSLTATGLYEPLVHDYLMAFRCVNEDTVPPIFPSLQCYTFIFMNILKIKHVLFNNEFNNNNKFNKLSLLSLFVNQNIFSGKHVI